MSHFSFCQTCGRMPIILRVTVPTDGPARKAELWAQIRRTENSIRTFDRLETVVKMVDRSDPLPVEIEEEDLRYISSVLTHRLVELRKGNL